MVKNRDIIVVGQQAWDIELGSNCKNIATEFSKHNRVLYVNPPLDRITMIRGRNDEKVKKRLRIINHKETGLLRVGTNIWNLYPDRLIESINWIKNHKVYDWFNRYNNKILASVIKRAITELGFSNVIMFNDSDMFRSFYLKELINPDLAVYYSRDYLLAENYYKHHGKVFEPRLIAKSDVCVANSTFLTNYCKRYNPNSFYVGQGCDLSGFTKRKSLALPPDMKHIKGPIIGYVGALVTVRLDLDILINIALNHPEWSLVLVGPQDDHFKISKLHQLNNVHFLGSKDAGELPAYINAFDVCINPQILSAFTIGNYPRKVDEYLALGKPVVATRTEAMEVFKDYTYLSEKPEDYPALIEKALVEDNLMMKNNRIEFASAHTWSNNVKEIYKAIGKAAKMVRSTSAFKIDETLNRGKLIRLG